MCADLTAQVQNFYVHADRVHKFKSFKELGKGGSRISEGGC